MQSIRPGLRSNPRLLCLTHVYFWTALKPTPRPVQPENELILLVRSAGSATEIRRSLKTEPDRSLLASVRDDRFKQRRICVWVYHYDAEIVQVGLRGDLLNVVRLGILDIDHILSSVLKQADQHKVAKDPGVRSRRRLSAFCSRLRRLRNCRRHEVWIASQSGFLARVLRDYSV